MTKSPVIRGVALTTLVFLMIVPLGVLIWLCVSPHGLAYHLNDGSPREKIKWVFIGLVAIGFNMSVAASSFSFLTNSLRR